MLLADVLERVVKPEQLDFSVDVSHTRPREQKMLASRLPRVTFHPVYNVNEDTRAVSNTPAYLRMADISEKIVKPEALVSQNVLIEWLQKVDSPSKSSN